MAPPQPTSSSCKQAPQCPVFFVVLEVEPAGKGPLLVDPKCTQLSLQGGGCRSLVPVGFAGYAAAAEAAAKQQQWQEQQQQNHQKPQPPHQNHQQQHQLPDEHTNKQQTAQHRPPAAPVDHSTRPLLGTHASAAQHPCPGLAGISGPLQPIWRQLAAIVAPLLHPSSLEVDVRVSVLLHGPRGSGKQTAAKAAAAALGMNFVSWSCHDLKVGGVKVGGGWDWCCYGHEWLWALFSCKHSCVCVAEHSV